MGQADFYKPGSHNKICDRTGFKIKAEDARQEWTKAIVRKQSWEPRHPQDLIRSVPDRQAVPNARSEPIDQFLAVNEVKAEDLNGK